MAPPMGLIIGGVAALSALLIIIGVATPVWGTLEFKADPENFHMEVGLSALCTYGDPTFLTAVGRTAGCMDLEEIFLNDATCPLLEAANKAAAEAGSQQTHNCASMRAARGLAKSSAIFSAFGAVGMIAAAQTGKSAMLPVRAVLAALVVLAAIFAWSAFGEFYVGFGPNPDAESFSQGVGYSLILLMVGSVIHILTAPAYFLKGGEVKGITSTYVAPAPQISKNNATPLA